MSFSSELKALFEKYDVVVDVSEISGILDFYTNRGFPCNGYEHVSFRANPDNERTSFLDVPTAVMRVYEH